MQANVMPMTPMTPMTQSEKTELFETCEQLINRHELGAALKLLEPLHCVRACYLRGSVYLAEAERIVGSFMYQHYRTADLEFQYRRELMNAHKHLNEAASLLPESGRELQDLLNGHIWFKLGRTDNELARTRPMEDDNNNDEDSEYEDDDFKEHEEHHVTSLGEEIQYWTLTE